MPCLVFNNTVAGSVMIGLKLQIRVVDEVMKSLMNETSSTQMWTSCPLVTDELLGQLGGVLLGLVLGLKMSLLFLDGLLNRGPLTLRLARLWDRSPSAILSIPELKDNLFVRRTRLEIIQLLQNRPSPLGM